MSHADQRNAEARSLPTQTNMKIRSTTTKQNEWTDKSRGGGPVASQLAQQLVGLKRGVTTGVTSAQDPSEADKLARLLTSPSASFSVHSLSNP